MSYKSSYTGTQIDAAIAKVANIPTSKTIVGTDSSGNIIDASTAAITPASVNTAKIKAASLTSVPANSTKTVTVAFTSPAANGFTITFNLWSHSSGQAGCLQLIKSGEPSDAGYYTVIVAQSVAGSHIVIGSVSKAAGQFTFTLQATSGAEMDVSYYVMGTETPTVSIE